MKQQEVKKVVVKETDMGFEVEVNGRVWRWPTWEMMMKEVEQMVGPCGVERQVVFDTERKQ